MRDWVPVVQLGARNKRGRRCVALLRATLGTPKRQKQKRWWKERPETREFERSGACAVPRFAIGRNGGSGSAGWLIGVG